MKNKRNPYTLVIGLTGVALMLLIAMALVLSQTGGGGGGGGGAPTDATYVTLTTNATLTAERVLTGTANQVIVTDNGAGSTVVLSLPQDIDTDADVDFGTGVFDGQTTSSDAAVVLQNIANATSNLILDLQGPDRTTPANNDAIYARFLQEVGTGFTEVVRLESRVTSVSGPTEGVLRIQNLDNGSLTLNATFENNNLRLNRFGGALIFTAANGVSVHVSASSQTGGVVTLTIPDAGDTSDTLVLEDAIQILTGKTLDGDDNTFVDIKPDQWDNVDVPANGECATYQSNQIQWEVCGGGGGTPFYNDLPVPSGGSIATSAYSGLPGVTFNGSVGSFITSGDIYYQAFYTDNDITINRATFEVTSAGNPGDACRIGIYEMDSNFQPGALVADWGQVINDTLGVKHTTVNTPITTGAYLIALLCNTGPALEHYSGKSYLNPGVDATTTANARFVENLRVSSPTGTPFASGYADPGQDWDAVDLNQEYNMGYFVILRWSIT